MKSNRVYRYLTSIKLTIILLTAMAICFVLDTVFEAVHLIHSVPMYIMAALFAVNLTLCTLKRTEWAAKKSALKFDPAVWGSPVLHIGLIVIMFGACLSWLIGRQTYYEIPVGEVAQFAGRSGTIDMTIGDFHVEYYEDNNSPKQYITDLILDNRKGETVKETVYVNAPVRYDGVTIIQQSYGFNYRVKLATPYTSRTLEFKKEEWIPLTEESEGSKRLGLTFYPDYDETKAMSELNSMKDDNPRLLWVLTEFGQPVAMNVLKPGEEADITDGIRLTFEGYEHYTGLQAKYDPGVKVIFTGFIVFFAGLIIRYSTMLKKEKEKEKSYGYDG